MSENKSPPYGYNGRGSPATPKEQEQSAAIGESIDAPARQRKLELLKAMDNYIAPKGQEQSH